MTYPDLARIQLDTAWLRERRGFITGATGWIGSWVCQALEHIGARYLPLKHTDQENIDNFRIPDCKIDYIIHLAPGRVDRVIECARIHNVDALFFPSSGAVYMQEPKNDYAIGKEENEFELIRSGIPAKIGRLFTFAGPGVPLYKGFALGCFIGQALNNQSLKIWTDGNTIRTYMYMTDLITWLFRIMIWGKVGETYNVGAEEEVTIWELAHMIRRRFDPIPEIVIHHKEHVETFPVYVPDITLAELLGCRVTIPLGEAIDKTVDYYKERYAQDLSDM